MPSDSCFLHIKHKKAANKNCPKPNILQFLLEFAAIFIKTEIIKYEIKVG